MERAPSAFALTSPMLEGDSREEWGGAPHTSKIGASENSSHNSLMFDSGQPQGCWKILWCTQYTAIPIVEFSREGYKIRKVFG